MKAPTTLDSRSQLDLLKQACDKHLSAEIEVVTQEGDLQRGRVRLIRWDDDSVYIDKPTHRGMPLELASDAPATLHFFSDKERYAFRSRVREECWIDLDGNGQRLPGYALALPKQVYRDERRHDYRVALGQTVEVVCEVRPLDGAEPGSFQGRIMDLSAGGLGLIAVDTCGIELQAGRHYQVCFELPKIKRVFELRARLCHLRSLHGSGFILGMQYPSDTTAAEGQAIRQVSQFVAKQVKHQRSRMTAT